MRNICFLLVPDFDQHSKIEFLKLCLYVSISFSGRCPKGWQDGVDEGLGCIWAEVCLVRSYSVPSIYHLLQTNKGTSGIITCICISNKYQNLRWCDSFWNCDQVPVKYPSGYGRPQQSDRPIITVGENQVTWILGIQQNKNSDKRNPWKPRNKMSKY